MSGIAGIVNLDGAPVDRALLESQTAALRPRGPDGDAVWVDRSVGLGHTLLRTTDEASRESGPATLDEEVWITADARLDRRGELIRELSAAGVERRAGAAELAETSDDELLLHSYLAWGESCLERLIGDFAFAIWDGRRKRLFCARDQLGVRPFFYALAGSSLIFASELDCVRRHPGVADVLNDVAIADLLLCGHNQEPDTTAFAGIQRLPGAHVLSASEGRSEVRRYWRLELPDETRYKRSTDYVEHFEALLGAAVEDRLRTDHADVLMSGGVDSTLIAAVAGERQGKRGHRDLHAHSIHWEQLIPHDEKRYASIAADALGIPIRFHDADPSPLFGAGQDRDWRTPEPWGDPLPGIGIDVIGTVAEHSRVALTGFDGDALCDVWLPSHFRDLLQSLRLFRALSDAAWLRREQGTWPTVGLRSRVRAKRGAVHPSAPEFPPWLNRELVERLDLRERWRRVASSRSPAGKPTHAPGAEQLSGMGLRYVFDLYDPAMTGSAVDVRHPLLDLRIVDYLLSVPAIPWAVDKTILRRAAARSLPPAITRRPKSFLVEDPVARLARQPEFSAPDPDPPPELARYVDPSALPPLSAVASSQLLWPLIWTRCLERWLRLLSAR